MANVPGTDANEVIQGWSGSGADSLTGGGYADLLHGGDGNDTLKGLGGNDTLHGGFGADRLEGGDGNDMLRAAAEDNPDTHADRLYGGAGHDRLFIGQGDFAYCGTEVDHISIDLSDQAAGVSFVFTNGLVRVNAATSFTGAESLEFLGTGGNDSVTSGGLSDALYGNNGNDTLRGGAGTDVLDDGAGNDKMYGDAGNDVLIRSAVPGTDIIDGGEGIDTLRFSLDATRSVILDLSDNANNGGAAKDLVVAGVEIVHGSNMDDDVRGTTASETFLGGNGDDFLSGGAGDDILAGGEEGDLLVGGAGKDQFVFREDGRGTGDQVSDFTRGQDKLVIGRLDFGIAVPVTPGLVVAADPRVSGTGPQFLFETDNGRLWFDRDGAGGVHEAQLIVTLAGDNGHVTALALSDFLLV